MAEGGELRDECDAEVAADVDEAADFGFGEGGVGPIAPGMDFAFEGAPGFEDDVVEFEECGEADGAFDAVGGSFGKATEVDAAEGQLWGVRNCACGQEVALCFQGAGSWDDELAEGVECVAHARECVGFDDDHAWHICAQDVAFFALGFVHIGCSLDSNFWCKFAIPFGHVRSDPPFYFCIGVIEVDEGEGYAPVPVGRHFLRHGDGFEFDGALTFRKRDQTEEANERKNLFHNVLSYREVSFSAVAMMRRATASLLMRGKGSTRPSA